MIYQAKAAAMNAMQPEEMHNRKNLAPNLRKLMRFNAINTPRSSELFWCGAGQTAIRLLSFSRS